MISKNPLSPITVNLLLKKYIDTNKDTMKLEKLYCSNVQLENDGLEGMLRLLPLIPTLTYINLSANKFTTEIEPFLIDFIINFP